ncbi:MAG: GNAT family N-acetyltransferase [Chloroflexi bacterium]|nr:GNAT family N-acetyltransferase [Chloroflexota bacterium]
MDDEIVLRIPNVEDAETLYGVIDRNRDYLREWLDFVPGTSSVEVTRGVIERWQQDANEASNFNYVIEYSGSIIGACGAMRLQERQNLAELGYWLAEDMQGRGIVTRICRALLRWLFEDRKVNRVEICSAAPNKKSRAVPERLGFTLEGYLRDQTLLDGKYFDTAVYSMLAREWASS